jgi:2'-5' RNA ligase
MPTAVATPTRERFFVGLAIPERVCVAISEGLIPFQSSIQRLLPEERWHITLLFLGEIDSQIVAWDKIIQPATQLYLPTITVTHIGKGLAKNQLWAWVLLNQGLQNMQHMIAQRFANEQQPTPQSTSDTAFVPHIHLANIHGVLLPDRALSVTFVPREINVYRSDINSAGERQYVVIHRIPLVT